jgi:hypothetical protein
MRKKKFRKGRVYTSVEQVARDVSEGKWIYYNHKPLHQLFIVHAVPVNN